MPTQFETTILPDLLADSHRARTRELAMQAKEFRRQNPNRKTAGIFHKDAVLNVLNNPDCVALRYYFGITTESINVKNPTLILCAVDANGNDIIAQNQNPERSWSCPPHCSASKCV